MSDLTNARLIGVLFRRIDILVQHRGRQELKQPNVTFSVYLTHSNDTKGGLIPYSSI